MRARTHPNSKVWRHVLLRRCTVAHMHILTRLAHPHHNHAHTRATTCTSTAALSPSSLLCATDARSSIATTAVAGRSPREKVAENAATRVPFRLWDWARAFRCLPHSSPHPPPTAFLSSRQMCVCMPCTVHSYSVSERRHCLSNMYTMWVTYFQTSLSPLGGLDGGCTF